jgi:hypothetical protein
MGKLGVGRMMPIVAALMMVHITSFYFTVVKRTQEVTTEEANTLEYMESRALRLFLHFAAFVVITAILVGDIAYGIGHDSGYDKAKKFGDRSTQSALDFQAKLFIDDAVERGYGERYEEDGEERFRWLPVEEE